MNIQALLEIVKDPQKNVEYVTKYRRERKKKMMKSKGGKCSICGKKKSAEKMEFHHTDPSKKKIEFAEKGRARSWEKTKKELKKTRLVCKKCHGKLKRK